MKIKHSLTIGLLYCTGLLSQYATADQAVLIGGGYNINGSQGQIELNVKWVQDVLETADIPVTTFFTDGDDPAPDVFFQQNSASITDTTDAEPATASDDTQALNALANAIEPVSRLFNNHYMNRQVYRNHTVENVSGSTRADELSNALTGLLSSAPDEPHLLIYNGHGRQSPSSVDKVTLELWGDTQLTANELHSVLDASNAPTRFVFTQCYSGGFHRLAYKNPSHGLELSDNMRCGFTAESAYRLAEGCSASIETGDYRDYTTFFFAALNGYDRDGEILPVMPDSNNDGDVTLREAHFYTLEHAFSTDMSRSTSEDYLENWQPWYLRWTSSRPNLPNNEYAKLFRALAAKHNINLDGTPAKTIRAQLNQHQQEEQALKTQRDGLLNNIADVQGVLAEAAATQWPALIGPYTAAFQVMAANGELLDVSSWLEGQPEYEELMRLQESYDELEASILEAQRNVTQMQKLFHFRKLANLQHQLYEYGSASQIKDYESLVACEDAPLVFA